jgi:hypothetical protein
VKKILLKKVPNTYLGLYSCINTFLPSRYQELQSLESEYTKEELFKLCSEGKLDMYGCFKGGVWQTIL